MAVKYEDRRRKLGQRIQRLRQESDYSQEAFSKLIRISPAHLSKIERGVKIPSLDLLFKMADTLQVPPQDLFKEVGLTDTASIRGIKERLDTLLSVTTPKKAKLILQVAREIHSSE